MYRILKRTTWRGVLSMAMLVAMAAGSLVATVPAPVAQAAPSGPGPVLPEGMDAVTMRTIESGLNYLAKTQRNNGSWLNSGGYGTYPTAMTGLAGTALLASGSTPESGPYARNVKKAMNFLLNILEAGSDGLIATEMDGQTMHGHGFALLFLAECYGMTNDAKTEERLKKQLERAVQLTQRAQSNLGKQGHAGAGDAGGWTYSPGGGDEGSVTVTQLQALRACRNAGIKVEKSCIERAVAYLKYCKQPDGGICYSAASRFNSTPAISAAAIACFYAAGVYDTTASNSTTDEAKMVEKLWKYCKQADQPANFGNSGHAYYTALYMSQAMYQRGGQEWKEYYPLVRNWLSGQQSPDGSWNGDSVGTTYGTAIACIILQLPYAYVPVYQRVGSDK